MHTDLHASPPIYMRLVNVLIFFLFFIIILIWLCLLFIRPRRGQQEVWADNLPGFGDDIIKSGSGGKEKISTATPLHKGITAIPLLYCLMRKCLPPLPLLSGGLFPLFFVCLCCSFLLHFSFLWLWLWLWFGSSWLSMCLLVPPPSEQSSIPVNYS